MTKEKTKEAPEKKAWRIEKCSWDFAESTLNDLAAEGYNIFKIEPLPDRTSNSGLFCIIVAFDPMHMVKMMQQGQMESLKALMNSGKMPKMPGSPGVGR